MYNKMEPMYPIVSLRGKFSTIIFKTYDWGIDMVPLKKIKLSQELSKRIAEGKTCQGFAIADDSYKRLSGSSRKVWFDALKAPGLSAYTLWMKETLACFSEHGCFCKRPSISGGFCVKKIIPYPEYPKPSERFDDYDIPVYN